MGKFKLVSKGSTWHFNLVAGNGEPILSSEVYESKQGALSGIESVRKNSQRDDVFETKATKSDHFYFVLKAVNGQVIGQSEMYSSAAACKNGIESVANNAPDAEIAEA